MTTCCPILELRQYTLHPGRRDTLVDLFEATFIESQEAVGIRVLGQFLDLDDPNRFVWLRGFSDMAQRAEALAAFYDGPVWRAHRDAANATMLDSDNVLLLRPTGPAAGFSVGLSRAALTGGDGDTAGIVTAAIHYLDAGAADAFAAFFSATMRPAIVRAGGSVLATLATEAAPNSFPRLPVREGEHVFLWFGGFADRAALTAYQAVLAEGGDWRQDAPASLLRRFMRKPETLVLAPTRRSLLR